MYREQAAESIIASTTDNGYISSFINSSFRKETLDLVHNKIVEAAVNREAPLHHTSGDLTAAKEILDKTPLYCNLIKQLNFENILFVPHYNAGKSFNWLISTENFPDIVPFERMYLDEIIDYNIMMHFIPILLKQWWGITSTVTVPPESKYNNLMHDLYREFGLQTINISQQYRIGEWFRLEPYPEETYDAVVFLNVEPENTSEIKHYWQMYCKEDFKILDIRYNSDEVLLNDDAADISREISGVIGNKTAWDPVCRMLGMQMDAAILKRSVHLY
jgi:hypothetical protein